MLFCLSLLFFLLATATRDNTMESARPGKNKDLKGPKPNPVLMGVVLMGVRDAPDWSKMARAPPPDNE